MWPNPQETADLVTLTEEILNGKLHFLCSDLVLLFKKQYFFSIWHTYGNKKNNPEVPTIVFYTTRKTTRLYKESNPISDWVFRRQNEEFEGFKNIVKERKKIRTDKMQKDVLWESKKMRKVLPGDMRCLW